MGANSFLFELTPFRRQQDLSAYRIAHMTAPCPLHKNFNVKLIHFANADTSTIPDANTKGGAIIAVPVHSYTQAKKTCPRTG